MKNKLFDNSLEPSFLNIEKTKHEEETNDKRVDGQESDGDIEENNETIERRLERIKSLILFSFLVNNFN